MNVCTTQAAKEKSQQEKDSMSRQMGMSRGGSRRGQDRGDSSQVGPDGWAIQGGSAVRAPPKAGDLSQFGKIAKPASTSISLGPSSVFAKKGGGREGATLSRTNSSTNMFSMLNTDASVENAPSSSKFSRPPSRTASVDLSQAAASESAPTQRRKLALLPRSVPTPGETAESKAEGSAPPSEPVSEHEDEEEEEEKESEKESRPSMSAADAKKKIDQDVKEFFAIRNLDEAEEYFAALPSEHRHLLVDKLVSSAIESKEADAKLVGDFFERAVSKDLCSAAAFEEGFIPTAEILDDVAIDAPKAFDLMAIMLKGTNLDSERQSRIAGKSMDSDKLLALLA